MRRQTSRGARWRGGIRPRRAVLSARARASLRRDALARVEFGCRWYDAETGRWISKDPILLDGGWNVYFHSGYSRLIEVRQAKLGRTNSGRSYIVKKSTYD
jgi:hypothetical protein